jgi:HEPN domain-containing protein
MDTQQRLEHVAERYRDQGYRVILNPTPNDLPSFAKDFKVEILASRPDGNVLASAKASSSEFEKDKNLSRYAEIIAGQQGWRYDVFVLGPQPPIPASGDIPDASDDEIERTLASADNLLLAGFKPQAVLASWAALESAMRHRLRSLGEKAEWGASPRSIINELVSSGVLTHGDFRDIEELSRLRNIIAHGFSVPEIRPDTVSFLARTARRLLEESKQREPAA